MPQQEPNWHDLLVASRTSAEEAARAAALRKQAGILMWRGALLLIDGWNSDADPDGDNLYAAALEALGKSRKSAASKIRAVALASRDLDLHPDCYGNLNEAYRNAKRLAESTAEQTT
jgi:hypothetical protein